MSESGRIHDRRRGLSRRQDSTRYRTFFYQAPIGLYRTTHEGRFLMANPALARLLGYADVDELMELPVSSFDMEPEQRLAQIELIGQTRAPVVSEICLRRKDGTAIWVRDTISPVYDARGRLLYYEGSLEDVTERRRAEQTAARLNRALRTVMQCSEAIVRARDEITLLDQVCAILVDVGGFHLAWVGRAEQDERHTIRPVACRGPASSYVDEITVTWADEPTGRGPMGVAIRTARPFISRDVTEDSDFIWRDQALRYGLRSVLALPLLVRGRAVAALGIYAAEADAFDAEELRFLETLAQDVSLGIASLRSDAERDELLEALFVSERRLREMLESVQLVVVALDCEGEITFCNEYLARLAGARRLEIIGSNWLERFVPADQRSQFAEAFQRLLGVSSQSAHFESDLLTVAGERRTISWNFTTTRDINARVIGVTGIGEDITDRLRTAAARDALMTQVVAAHERLQSLSRQLVRVQEEERRNLARELHDEIGQSLTALKIMLDMALKAPATAGVQLRQAQVLLNELIAKVRNLSLDLRPGMLDDLGLLPALLWLLDRYTQQTNVQVSFHHARLEDRRFAPEIETAAYRVVQEALTNVARHAQTDRAAVEVTALDGMLSVEVRDEGCGFDPAVTLAAGYAAGLSGLRERVALLSGRLIIESAPGRGTCIRAELPVG